MIEVKNLTKRYGSFTAVRDVSFSIEKGHIYGLLGPNGAGKSTTMNIITGCLAATEGQVSVGGFDIYEEAKKAKKMIGYLPEIPPLYTDMSPYEYLKFVGASKSLPKNKLDGYIEDVMKKTGITEVSDRLIRNLSKGYKQRVGIAQALLGDPEIIILDEPTVGLDPTQLIEIRELIRSLKEEHAVILSSHIMSEITAVCDYVIIIAHGKIVAKGTLEELEGSANSNTVTIESRGSKELLEAAVNALEGVKYCRFSETGTTVKAVIETAKGVDLREALFFTYAELGAPILEMTSSAVDLEDLFIKLTSVPDTDDVKEERPVREKKKYIPSPLGQAYIEDEADSSSPDANKASEDSDGADGDEGYSSLFSDEEGGNE